MKINFFSRIYKLSFFNKKNKEKKIKKLTRNEELLDQYNKGLILQVDNKKNNKEYFKKILENEK